MEFFGLTMYGPQNYIHDMVIDKYKVPMNKEEVKPLMEKVKEYSTLPETIQRPDVDVIRFIDLYMGRVNGFSYGSAERYIKMKRKGVMLPPFPCDIYRFPPTTYNETHTGSKPFKCHICGDGFAHSGNRSIHIRTKHQNYKCVPKKHKRGQKVRRNKKHYSSDTENTSSNEKTIRRTKRKTKKKC